MSDAGHPRPRWFTETAPDHSQRYLQRFRDFVRDGADLAGEARLIDALVAPRSRVLDAGCGTGRTAAALHARGHTVVGVDADPVLIDGAAADHPGPRWVVGDLTELQLDEPPFDAAVLAGNVLLFVAERSERRVLERVAAHVRPDGVVVVGFATGRGYDPADLAADAASVGLDLEHRFSTWDLRPWRDDATWLVAVLRVSGTDAASPGGRPQ